MKHPDLGHPSPYSTQNGYNISPDQPILDHGQTQSEGSGPHIARIKKMNGFYVKQKPNWCEILTKCRMPNKYKIYDKSPSGDERKGDILYQCKEISGCFCRTHVSNCCRPFKVDIVSVNSNGSTEKYQPCLEMEKPCVCNVLWCNVPYVNINYVENGQSVNLGKIIYPYVWCCNNLDINDAKGNRRFTVHADCCQCGFWCKCPYQNCQTFVFDVYGGEKSIKLGSIIRTQNDYFKACYTDLDSFSFGFDSSMDWKDRSLLLCASIFLDYMKFEF